MDGLRLVLLIVGVIVIAGIYFWETRRRRLRRLDNKIDFGGKSRTSADGFVDGVGPVRVVSRKPEPPPDTASVERTTPVLATHESPGEPLVSRQVRVSRKADERVRQDPVLDMDRLDSVVDRASSSPVPADSMGPPVAPVVEESGVEEPAAFTTPTPELLAGTQDEVAAPSREKEPLIEEPPPPEVIEPQVEAPEPPRSSASARRKLEPLDLSGIKAEPPPDIRVNPDNRESQGGQSSNQPPEEPLVVVLTVMAKGARRFAGTELRLAFEEQHLVHSEDQVFDYINAGQPGGGPLFSVVNVIKPGTFERATMDESTTPGVALFLRVPGPSDPAHAFERMLSTARRLGETLDGTICDETRSTLTNQSVNHLRERIAEYGRKRLLRNHLS